MDSSRVSVAAQLDRALRAAGLPIVGVSLGRLDDKTTWRVDFTDPPTEDQQTQRDAILGAFVEAPDIPPISQDDLNAYVLSKLGVTLDTARMDIAAQVAIDTVDAVPVPLTKVVARRTKKKPSTRRRR